NVFDFYDHEVATQYFEAEEEIIKHRKTVRSVNKVVFKNNVSYLSVEKTSIYLPETDDWGLLVIQEPIEASIAKSEAYQREMEQKYRDIIFDIN
ncbi:MAG: hypothetical protein AAF551_04920, partial [Bacteroidota bacterium]